MGDLLPRDALRHVFAKLNGRTLCCCAAVCRFWQEVANEDALWHQVTLTEYYRPNLLAYAAAWLPAGWSTQAAVRAAVSLGVAAARDCLHAQEPRTAGTSNDDQAFAATNRIETQQEQQHEGSQEHSRQQPALGMGQDVSKGSSGLSASSSPKAGLKDLCLAGMLHSAAPHQALLARFHAALQHITGWRVVVTANIPAPPHNPEAAAQADTECAAALDPTTGQPPENPPPEPQQHTTQAAAAGPSLASASASNSPSSSNCCPSRRPVAGHPAALTMQALLSGGWAVGCVEMQQQEQSCWVRFNLPHELVRTPAVLQALNRRELVVTLQGLGPSGWFDVATCDKFELLEEEMEILMQSHRSGFYAWDQAGEVGGGVDRYGQLEPLPWDVAPGATQQQQQQQVPTTAQELADSVTGQQQPHPLPQSPVQQQQQQEEEEEEEMDFGEPEPQLRMLVYVHYEQLLQVLPFALPQVLPLPPAPVFNNSLDFSRHLIGSDCSLWLQLDVCQLHGGFKLGTCVVPLALKHWSEFKAKFVCKTEQVLVALYDPGSSLNSTQGLGGQEPPATAAAADAVAARVHSTAAGTSAAAAAAAGTQHSIFGQEACRQLLLGDACLYGEGCRSEDGIVVSSADDALHVLMTMDEIMVDFALFDAQGHLLMGRAGVEVWSREVTSLCIVPQHAAAVQPLLPRPQPPLPRPQRTGKNSSLLALQLQSLEASIGALGWDASLSMQQRQSAEAAAARRELTAMHVETLQEAAYDDDIAGVDTDDETIMLTRSVQKLHFLVDGGPSRFWETYITIDAERPSPAHAIVHREGPVSLQMPWSNVRPMFGLPPFTRSD